MASSFPCKFCNEVLTTKFNLLRHEHNKHRADVDRRRQVQSRLRGRSRPLGRIYSESSIDVAEEEDEEELGRLEGKRSSLERHPRPPIVAQSADDPGIVMRRNIHGGTILLPGLRNPVQTRQLARNFTALVPVVTLVSQSQLVTAAAKKLKVTGISAKDTPRAAEGDGAATKPARIGSVSSPQQSSPDARQPAILADTFGHWDRNRQGKNGNKYKFRHKILSHNPKWFKSRKDAAAWAKTKNVPGPAFPRNFEIIYCSNQAADQRWTQSRRETDWLPSRILRCNCSGNLEDAKQ